MDTGLNEIDFLNRKKYFSVESIHMKLYVVETVKGLTMSKAKKLRNEFS